MHQRSLHPRRAFTLVELLTVIAIIAILAGLILSTAGYIQKKGAQSRAEAEIAAMEAALESYRADNGVYPIPPNVSAANPPTPTDENGLANNLSLRQALMPVVGDPGVTAANINTRKIYMEFKPNQLNDTNPTTKAATSASQIVDPWGTPYRYNAPGRFNTATFDLWSIAGQPISGGSGDKPNARNAYNTNLTNSSTYLNLITNWGNR